MRSRRTPLALGEQSHPEEMNAAIRAQRERLKAAQPPPKAAPPSLARLFARLLGQ